MQNLSEQKIHKSKNNFKELKSFILNTPCPDVQFSTPLPSQQFNPEGLLKLDHPSLKINSRTFTSKNSAKDTPTSRRLNLKEYMHLNSIEKKAKSRSFNKSTKPDNDNSTLAAGNSLQLRKAEQGQASLRHQEKIYCCDVLKEEVEKKLEEEIKRLQELSRYFSQDYVQKHNEKESELFLFDVLKGLEKTGKIHTQIGEKVYGYEGETREGEKQNYYWCRSKKVLQSPAKMKTAYELTVSSFEILSRTANKEPTK